MADRRIVVAADAVAEAGSLLARSLEAFDRPRLAIPGGSAVRALAKVPTALWPRVRLTWVDERCVDFADSSSNRGEAHRAGLLTSAPVFELPLYLDQETPEAACVRVRAGLEAQLQSALDVALLGMGEDGHVASLFPGRAAEGELVAAVLDSPKPPPRRITLTLPMLQTAKSVILLATGEGKRAALQRLLKGEPALPASALESMIIVTDLGGLR
ncbi:MAG: 6-phosphogluconolactonase [Myxococcales bacterium]